MASDQEHAKAAIKSIASALGIEDLEFDPDFIKVGEVTISWKDDLWVVGAPATYRALSELPISVQEGDTVGIACRYWHTAVSRCFEFVLCELVALITEAEELAQKCENTGIDENLN